MEEQGMYIGEREVKRPVMTPAVMHIPVRMIVRLLFVLRVQ
jgi:hypothetical protein